MLTFAMSQKRPWLLLATAALLLLGCNVSLQPEGDETAGAAPAPDAGMLEDASNSAEEDDTALTAELERLRAEAAEEERRLAEREELLREREVQLARAEEAAESERRVRERERQLADRERELVERERQARLAAEQLEQQGAELEAIETRVAEARQELDAEAERLERQAEAAAPPPDESDIAAGWSSEEDWRSRRRAAPVNDELERDTDEGELASAAERLRAGMELEVEILEDLSSRDSKVGDVFRTQLASEVRDRDGSLILPAGTEVVGVISEARPLRQVGGQAALGLEFHELILESGERIEIEATFLELGANQKKDKKKIIGAAVAGAILGRILGDGDAAAVGGLVGAAAGTAAVMKSKGQEVEIPLGTTLRLELTEVVTTSTRYGPVVDRNDR